MGLLYDAAATWEKLIDCEYVITLGKKGNKHSIVLTFSASEFYHAAGFQHLTDIQLPIRGSKANYIQFALDGRITDEDIGKSQNYIEDVMPRLKAISLLPALLDNNGSFSAYRFDPQRLSFYTDITADYLFMGKSPDIVFMFTGGSDSGLSVVKSTFIKGSRDFSQNQTRFTVLKVEKHNLVDGTIINTYTRPGYSETKEGCNLVHI